MYAVYVSRANRRPLDRKRVVRAAFALADEAGLAGVSMRRLADSLGVTPMALYKHVAGREEILDLMVDELVERIDVDSPEVEWKRRLRARILAAREAMSTHAWAQEAIETRAQATPQVLAYMDGLMSIMFEGGFSADLVHHAMHALSTRMWGFTRDVLPMPVAPEDPAERTEAFAAFARSYPSIARMASTSPHAGGDCDDDAEFAFALDLLLDGFERLHSAGWTSV